MTRAGAAQVARAKAMGRWQAQEASPPSLEMPGALQRALARNAAAKRHFEQLAPTYRKQFIGWVAAAKREETRDRRVAESVAFLKQGKRLGMK